MKPRAALAALGAFAGLALVGAGCGDQSGSPIGFGDTTPTGGTFLFVDVQPANADSSQVGVLANVLDASGANGFRLYVNPGEQGTRSVTDYVADPQNAFSTGYNFYVLGAQTFDPTVNNVYVAHGARGEIESDVSAVSEHAFVPASGDPKELARRFSIQLISPIGLVEVDTVPQLTWSPVPDAAKYLVLIANTNGLTYLALVPGSTHKVQDQPAFFFQNVPLRANFFYSWQVIAITADNRIIGVTPAPDGFITRRF